MIAIQHTIQHAKFFPSQVRGDQPKVWRSYNPSACGSLIAYRCEHKDEVLWRRPCRIAVAHLIRTSTGDFYCRGNKALDLQTTTGWCEDPRLFKWGHDMWLFYTDGRRMHAALLDDDLNVAWNTQLEYGDDHVEKNWTPWVVGDQLFALYRTWPFEVISIERTAWNLRCRRVSVSDPDGMPHTARGGAPMLDLGGRWLCCWQRHVENNSIRHYRIGFSLLRGSPEKPEFLWHADDAIVAPQAPEWSSVLFPGSCELLPDGTLRLACGLHDRECVIIDRYSPPRPIATPE